MNAPSTVQAVVVPAKTQGVSPKAALAGLLPTIGTVLAVLVQWIITGEYSEPELLTSVVGFIGALVSFLGAYLGNPGTVTAAVPTAVAVGPPSDSLLGADAAAQLEAVDQPPVRPSPDDLG